MTTKNLFEIEYHLPDGKTVGLKTGDYAIVSGTLKKSPEEIESNKMSAYLMREPIEGESWFDLFDFDLAMNGYMSVNLVSNTRPVEYISVLLLSLGLRALRVKDERCVNRLREFIAEFSDENQAVLKRKASIYISHNNSKHDDDSGKQYQSVAVALGLI